METIIQLSPKDLAFLVKTLEGCDGLAMVKTLEGKIATAKLIYPNDSKNQLIKLLQDMGKTRRIDILKDNIDI